MAKQTFTTGSVLTATQMNNLQANDYNWTVSQKTASYVLVAADAGTRIEMNTASNTTITVNTGLFAAGDTLFIQNIGSGSCVITAGTATVQKSANASLTLSQYQGGYLYFVSTSNAVFFADAGFTSPLTTKGDLFTWDTGNARLPVGTNGFILSADSTETTGLKWASPALTLVKSQTIGTTVSSVTVTDAFSSTYDNYWITLNLDTASAADEIYLTLGATATGYVNSFIYMAPNSNTVNGLSSSNDTSIIATYFSTDGGNAEMFIGNPNKAKKTTIFNNGSGFATAASTFTWTKSFLNNTTQYTAFTLTVSPGTISGGTIRVYGLANS